MDNISKKQTSVMLFLALISDVMVQPLDLQRPISAQTSILTACIQTVVLCVFILLLMRHWPVQPLSVAAMTILGVICLLAAVSALLRAEQFYRYLSDEPLPVAITLVLFALCIAYALFCRADTVARVSGLLFWLFCASLVLLAVGSIPSMQLTSLAPAQGVFAVLAECMRGIQLPVALLVCCILCTEDVRSASLGFLSATLGAGVLHVLLALGTELVLGTNARGHAQILNTLTRVGGISVFQRLDALHSNIWLLLLLFKAVLLMLGAQIALKVLFNKQNKHGASIAVLLIALLPCAAVVAAVPQSMHSMVLSIGVLMVFGCILVQGGAYAKISEGG